MNIELFIDSGPEDVSIALLEDKNLVEMHKEKHDKGFSVGDIFLGKVKKIVPSLNAAFIDVGYEKDAFLHYLDLGPQFNSLNNYTKRCISGKQEEAELTNFKLAPDINKHGKVKDVLSNNQNILVQIAKEPISSKGPRLTSEVTLPGRYLVLVPFSNRISFSQRIKNSSERERLRRLMQSILPKNFGVIIRTVAENKRVAQLDTDLKNLVSRWENIYGTLRSASPPKKLSGELNKTSTLLRDVLNSKFSAIHINNNVIFQQSKEYLRRISPDKENILKAYSEKVGLFDRFGIQKQIKASFGKHVALKSGAYLIIEHTEAMHVIDVNSGNRRGDKSQEQNAIDTNLECAKEIARLLRLRDMGGIIVVDFIDMQDRNNRKKLHDKLKEYMSADKAKHNVLPPSKFGVVEITRQRVRPETDIETTETCPACNGSGEVESTLLLTDEIENNLKYILTDLKVPQIELRVHPFIEAYLTRGLKSAQKRWFVRYKKWVKVKAVSSYHFLEYLFFDKEGKEIQF